MTEQKAIIDALLKVLNKKRQSNDEIDNDIKNLTFEFPRNFTVTYCSNGTHSNSLLLICKISPESTKILYFDQHSAEAVEINFSKMRLESFIDALMPYKNKTHRI